MTRLFILPAIFGISSLSLWYMICSAPGWNTDGTVSHHLLILSIDVIDTLSSRKWWSVCLDSLNSFKTYEEGNEEREERVREREMVRNDKKSPLRLVVSLEVRSNG